MDDATQLLRQPDQPYQGTIFFCFTIPQVENTTEGKQHALKSRLADIDFCIAICSIARSVSSKYPQVLLSLPLPWKTHHSMESQLKADEIYWVLVSVR